MPDPIDWAAWTYGKVGHWGLIVFLSFMFVAVGLVWWRGVEQYRKEHPENNPKHTGKPTSTDATASAEQVSSRLSSIRNDEYRTLVANVIHAFEPRAHITVGGAVIGPDGARIVDIQVWPVAGSSGPIVVDVIDRRDGTPVGIDAIDAAESKRKDINATAMLVCSNTGFDSVALSKAKRTKIGLISAIKRGDALLTGRIEEEIYLRKITIEKLDITYYGLTSSDSERLRTLKDNNNIKRSGISVAPWLQMRVSKALLANAMSPLLFATPKDDERILATFDFKKPTAFKVDGQKVTLKRISVAFRPQVQWLSQIVRLDATAAIYDYLRGRLKLAPGVQQYVIEGVNFDSAKPIDAPPHAETSVGVGLQPGEIDVRLIMLHGVVSPDPPKGLEKGFSELATLIRPEDLSLAITDKRNPAANAKPSIEGRRNEGEEKVSGVIPIE